jgi:hypothetical protein
MKIVRCDGCSREFPEIPGSHIAVTIGIGNIRAENHVCDSPGCVLSVLAKITERLKIYGPDLTAQSILNAIDLSRKVSI